MRDPSGKGIPLLPADYGAPPFVTAAISLWCSVSASRWELKDGGKQISNSTTRSVVAGLLSQTRWLRRGRTIHPSPIASCSANHMCTAKTIGIER